MFVDTQGASRGDVERRIAELRAELAMLEQLAARTPPDGQPAAGGDGEKDGAARPRGGNAGAALAPAGGQTLEERLKLAMASARLAWWDWDFARDVIAVYGDADCLLGYAFDTLPRSGEAWFAQVHPEDRAAVEAQVEACRSGRQPAWRAEHRFRCSDGSWRWVANSGRLAEPDAAGRATRMIGLTKDIQPRREAEEELRRDALILGQLHDIVMYCDADYHIAYVNDSFTRVLGYPRDAAIGQPVTYRFPPAMHAEIRNLQAHVMVGGTLDIEWQDMRADGTRVWINWRAQPILNPAGQVTGIINVGTDIDARKRAELERQELQRQLMQAQRMETLGALAGGIAHDFNNILSAIFGFTELALTRTPLDEPSKRMHRQVLKAAERARDLVRRILSFSRFHESERRPVAPVLLMEDAVRFIRAALPSTTAIELEIKDTCAPTLGDAHQIHQVLLNLATNGAHAIGDRHGQLRLTLRRDRLTAPRDVATGALPAGDYAVFDVADNGSGMDPDVQARIFEPFFTTKKEGEGTGLGLSVAAAIMRGHLGGIAVESVVGAGSCFSVYLPIVPGVTLPPELGEEAYAPRLRSRGEMIAIIDDEEPVAYAAEKILQAFGYRTATYANAMKFLEVFLVAPSGVDLILTDQTMPGMTGIELAIRLREERHEVPILLMTGFSRQLNPELIRSVAPAALLRKPFSRLDVAQQIRELLDGLDHAR